MNCPTCGHRDRFHTYKSFPVLTVDTNGDMDNTQSKSLIVHVCKMRDCNCSGNEVRIADKGIYLKRREDD